MIIVEFSTSDELAYELVKDLAVKNEGKIISDSMPANYIPPIKVPFAMLSDKGKELLGLNISHHKAVP